MTFEGLGLQSRSSSGSEFSLQEMGIQVATVKDESDKSSPQEEKEQSPEFRPSLPDKRISFLSISSEDREQSGENESVNLFGSVDDDDGEHIWHSPTASGTDLAEDISDTSSVDPASPEQDTSELVPSPPSDDAEIEEEVVLTTSLTKEHRG